MTIFTSLIFLFIIGALKGTRDARAHYPDHLIWRRYDHAFARWMMRGSKDRKGWAFEQWWIPTPLLEQWNDGWHASDSTLLLLMVVVWPSVAPGWGWRAAGLLAVMLGFWCTYEWWLDDRKGFRDALQEL